MSFADRVLHLLAEHPEGLSDGEIAAALHANHAQANIYCRQLAREGRIARDDFARPIRNRLPDLDVPLTTRPFGSPAETDRREEVVQKRVVSWLVREAGMCSGSRTPPPASAAPTSEPNAPVCCCTSR